MLHIRSYTFDFRNEPRLDIGATSRCLQPLIASPLVHTFKRLQRHHRLVWIKRGRLVNQRRPGFRIQSSKSCKRYIQKSKTPILMLVSHRVKNVPNGGFSIPEYVDTEYLSVFSLGSEKKDQKNSEYGQFSRSVDLTFFYVVFIRFCNMTFQWTQEVHKLCLKDDIFRVIAFKQWKLLDPFLLVIMTGLMTENVLSQHVIKIKRFGFWYHNGFREN